MMIFSVWSGTTSASSKKSSTPSPSQDGQAPNGALNENRRGSISGMVKPLTGQEKFSEKVIRSGLEAQVTVPASAVPDGFTNEDLAELFITASVSRSDSDEVTVTRTTDHKCGRCWRLLPEVAEDGDLCARCEDVVAAMDAAA